MRNSAGMMDIKKWDCGVPGKDKTIWEGGLFKLEVVFPDGASSPPSFMIPADQLMRCRVPYEASKVYERSHFETEQAMEC